MSGFGSKLEITRPAKEDGAEQLENEIVLAFTRCCWTVRLMVYRILTAVQ